MRRPDKTRWLYRGEKGDYGPMSTDELLEAIAQRKVNLGTDVSVLGANKWMPAGEIDILRDHYGTLAPRWERDRLIAEAKELDKKTAIASKTKSAFGGLALFGTVAGLVLAGVLVWQFTAASPVGFSKMARAHVVQALPEPLKLLPRGDGAVPKIKEQKVATLSEPESYDTAGIGVGDGSGNHVTTFQFDEDGSVAAIPEAELQRIMGAATAGLRSCAWQQQSEMPISQAPMLVSR